jgi:hypothetical protein
MSADAPDSLVSLPAISRQTRDAQQKREGYSILHNPRGILGFAFVPMASWLRLFHPQPLHLRRKK